MGATGTLWKPQNRSLPPGLRLHDDKRGRVVGQGGRALGDFEDGFTAFLSHGAIVSF